MFNVPVVIIVFNRPDVTAKLLACLERIKPSKVFVVADAARDGKEGELSKVNQTRDLIDNINWQCEVRKNYADQNMGCMKRVSSGLDWVFSEVDKAIILEDDCFPNDDFFEFCADMLERYECDERIMSISGTRLSIENKQQKSTYSFSKYSICWGWATWARAWALYDGDLVNYKKMKNTGYLSYYLGGIRPSLYWKYILDKVCKSKINSWAYRWMYSHWSNNALSIVPEKNLITNVGVGEDATHTKDDNEFLGRDATSLKKPFEYTDTVFCDHTMDAWIENNFYSKSILLRIKWFLNKLFK